MQKQTKAALIYGFGGPENIQIVTRPVPELQEGEVLVRVKAAGVNPVDYLVREGYLKDMIPHGFPLVLGWDVAGVVEERGFAARRFDLGQEVFGYARRPRVQYGTYSEYLVVPESYLALKPRNISFEEAAGIPLVGLTAYQCLFQAGSLEAGQTLLILGGSGGVGSLAIQLAKNRGAIVIGVASEKNHAFMQELGADHTIDYKAGHVGEAVNHLFPAGIDFILDCTSGETLQQSLMALKAGGTLVSILNHGQDIDPAINFHYVFVEPNSRQLEELAALADAGKLKVHVSQTYSLEETAEAQKQIQTLHTTGKIVIVPSEF